MVVISEYFHSVILDSDLCKGCINCIKRCPTEAIRVQNGKAYIITERCIDCGECIRVCPHHAKKARFDNMAIMDGFTYKIALPAPALYGQYNRLDDLDILLTGLKHMGFDDVFEVARAAELVTDATRKLMSKKRDKTDGPLISSACPAIVRLIQVRFPELHKNIVPLEAPMEIAAIMAKKEAAEKTGLPMDEIGAFFLSPCPAKVTAAKAPIGREKSAVDGVFAIKDVYPRLLEKMNKIDNPESLSQCGVIGVSWAGIGGEAAGLLSAEYLSADGIENVMRVLEELEDERLNELDFLELNACFGGCVGGVLNVENPYVAKARLSKLRKHRPVSCNHLPTDAIPENMLWSADEGEHKSVLKLSDDIWEAFSLMEKIDSIEKAFPQLDCGSCGAPTCRALAEDIVLRSASESSCVFRMRDEVNNAADALSALNKV